MDIHNNSNENAEPMSASEVVSELGISLQTLHRWHSKGRLVPLPKQSPAKLKEPRRYARMDVERLKSGK